MEFINLLQYFQEKKTTKYWYTDTELVLIHTHKFSSKQYCKLL
jgi:hypothetical protein